MKLDNIFPRVRARGLHHGDQHLVQPLAGVRIAEMAHVQGMAGKIGDPAALNAEKHFGGDLYGLVA